MAEIILAPTAQSKVIPLSLRLNDTDTSLVSQLVTNRQFNTADTDAWFGFTLEGLAATTGTFDLTLINLQDKSVFNHTDKAFSTNPFYYKLDSGTDELTNEIRHAGKWVGQLVVTLANGDSATRKFIFGIEGHILDGTVVQTILLEDYNALITDIEASKDELTQYNIDYASLIGTVTEQEAARLEAEELRVIADALRETKEGIRQATFEANEVIRDGVVDSAIEGEMISQTVATKLAEKEATYAPRLLSAEQQLAEADTRIDGIVTSAGNYYLKCLSTDTGALLVVVSGAIAGQINIVSVSPKLDTFTPIVGDYVRLVSNGLTAELVDVRIGANSITYPTAGTAIREQINLLKDDMTDFTSDIATLQVSSNLLDLADINFIKNKFIAPTTGNLSNNLSYDTTGFIWVTPGKKIKLTAFTTGGVQFLQNMRFIASFDANGNIMPTSGSNVDSSFFVIPSGVAMVRVSFINRTDYVNRGLFEVTVEDETMPIYEEYFDPYYNARVLTDKTLTFENEPADAKAVGNALEVINKNIVAYKNPSDMTKIATLSSGTAITIPTFPQMLKTGQSFSYSAKFASFGVGDTVSIGFINPAYGNYQSWMEISVDRVKWMLSGTSAILNNLHGLTLAGYLTVSVEVSPSTAQIKFTITTSGGSYSFTQVSDSTRLNAIGTLTAKSTMATTDVVLSGTCKQFKYHTWLLGDSYFGNGLDRLGGRLIEWGYASGVLFDGLGGLNSQNGYAELQKLLTYGTPKTLVWYLGMNDNATTVATYFPLVEQLCDQLGIELIFNKIPFVPSRLVENAAVNNYVLASGRRYVDSYAAVGADTTGNWYTGHLSVDGVHPANLGAAALTSRLIADVPEILSGSN